MGTRPILSGTVETRNKIRGTKISVNFKCVVVHTSFVEDVRVICICTYSVNLKSCCWSCDTEVHIVSRRVYA